MLNVSASQPGNVEDFEHDLLFSPKVIKKLTEAVKAEMKESE